MFDQFRPFCAAVALALIAAPALATTTVVMTFDEVTGDYTPFPDTIGDGANFDVSNRTRDDFGDASVFEEHIEHWGLNYSELVDVAFPSRSGGVGELQFDVDPGYQITIDSFRFGNYFDGRTPRNATFRIYDSGWSELWEFLVTGHTGDSVLVEPGITGTGTLYFQFGTDWNVGIDDVTYTSSLAAPTTPAIPLPAGLPLAAGALGMLALLRRRR